MSMSQVFHASLRLLLLLAALLALACSEGDPLVEIQELHATRQFAETVGPLRNIVDRDPDNTQALLMLGRALLRSDNAGLAVWPLRSVAEKPEYAVEAGLLLTEAMIESRSSPDAVKAIDRVLAIEPENLRALVLRVDANRAAGNTEESLADIDRVLELDPANLPVLVTRVTALISLERIDEAGPALDAAQESFDASQETVAHPMLARLCIARALFTIQNGDIETAERHYGECVERFPTDQVAVTESVTFYDRIGKVERATEILRRASEESEERFFRTILARRLGALGQRKEEERLLREEAETHPTSLSWFILADYYVQRDRFDQAINAFEAAMSISPGAARLRFAYADTLVQAERFDKARKVANRLKQKELRSLIFGRILLGEGNARGALVAFEEGIRLWPNNSVGRFLAGQAAEQIGDYQRAISHYRESFRTAPGESEAGLALAQLYATQGVEADALQIANRYVKARKKDPRAYLLSIGLANDLGRHRIVKEGLKRLAKLPGQAGVAAAKKASYLTGPDSAEKAVEVIEGAELDLTNPSNAIALRALIEQLGTLGQHEKAVGLVDKASAEYPDVSVFHELRGRARHAGPDPESAGASYERALELDGKSWRSLEGLAALAAEAGDTSRALSLYDRALEADPEDATTAFAAIALVRETDREATALRLEELLDRHPRTPAAALELAEIFLDRGELDRAGDYASRAAWFKLPEGQALVARIRELRGASVPTASDVVQQDEANE